MLGHHNILSTETPMIPGDSHLRCFTSLGSETPARTVARSSRSSPSVGPHSWACSHPARRLGRRWRTARPAKALRRPLSPVMRSLLLQMEVMMTAALRVPRLPLLVPQNDEQGKPICSPSSSASVGTPSWARSHPARRQWGRWCTARPVSALRRPLSPVMRRLHLQVGVTMTAALGSFFPRFSYPKALSRASRPATLALLSDGGLHRRCHAGIAHGACRPLYLPRPGFPRAPRIQETDTVSCCAGVQHYVGSSARQSQRCFAKRTTIPAREK